MKLVLNSATAKLRVDATRSKLGLPIPAACTTTMSAKHQQWHVTQRLINTLVLTYPVFRKRKPLAIGIHEVILAAARLRRARTLQTLCATGARRPEYLAALRNGGTRFALDGSPAGEVSPEQMADAAAQLTTMQRKGTRQ